jgi:hypothetical protein
MLKLIENELSLCHHLKYFYVFYLLLFGVCKVRLVGYVHRDLFLYVLFDQCFVRLDLAIDFVSYFLMQFVLSFGDVQVIVGDNLGICLEFHYRL